MDVKKLLKDILRPIARPVLRIIRGYKYRNEQSNFFNEISCQLKKNKFDAIIIFDVYFGFEVKMFQRPQHIALNLADSNILYFYKASPYVDKEVKTYKKIKDNLYLVNTDLFWLQEGLLNILNKVDIPKFAQIYSTSFTVYHEYLKKYTDKGFKIIYEYVDDLSDEIAGFKITKDIKESHDRMLRDKENVFVISTADKLFKEVVEKRGETRVKLITNGVQYEHFSNICLDSVPNKLKKIVENGNKIIGYFGALAKWFDYELVKKLANALNNCEIVLIGVNYDKSIESSGILELDNVHYIGTVDYTELPKYAGYFDVSTIPFVINDITEATSPVKLFEYMALGKPIVTTALPECKKYKSPLVSSSHEEFINNIKRALELENNDEYLDLLRTEARLNTWKQKAEDIKNLVLER